MSDVVLVDANDQELGTLEKLEDHKNGLLHRAFSIFIFNSQGELMLQQRATSKYHCGGLWTNTTCSHPAPGEKTLDAAHRRLKEEMGFDCELNEIFSFTYKKTFENGLTEHEFDHVFIGYYDNDPKINTKEADSWKWISIEKLQTDIKNHPESYTYWFIKSLPRVLAER